MGWSKLWPAPKQMHQGFDDNWFLIPPPTTLHSPPPPRPHTPSTPLHMGNLKYRHHQYENAAHANKQTRFTWPPSIHLKRRLVGDKQWLDFAWISLGSLGSPKGLPWIHWVPKGCRRDSLENRTKSTMQIQCLCLCCQSPRHGGAWLPKHKILSQRAFLNWTCGGQDKLNCLLLKNNMPIDKARMMGPCWEILCETLRHPFCL